MNHVAFTGTVPSASQTNIYLENSTSSIKPIIVIENMYNGNTPSLFEPCVTGYFDRNTLMGTVANCIGTFYIIKPVL